jgi:hypothetical protein
MMKLYKITLVKRMNDKDSQKLTKQTRYLNY